jgi:uncharacterized protein (DUF1697 family)
MKTWIALLRGINVGGNNKIAMAELRQVLEAAGCQNVRTLLQSGNAVLSSDIDSAEVLEETLESATHRKFGLNVDFVVLNGSAMKSIVDQNPFPDEAAADPSHLLVHFLKEEQEQRELERFAAKWKDVERLEVGSKVLYIYYPLGVGNSKLKIPFRGTARNWNTVLKLVELAREAAH